MLSSFILSLSMQKLLLVFLLFFSPTLFAQRGVLYVKKHGFKKVKSFEEGSAIKLKIQNQDIIDGVLSWVKKDSIAVNNHWLAVADIKEIILREKKSSFDYETLLWTTGGVIISTAGMTLAKWASFKNALAYSAGLGYGNFLIRYFPKFKRKKYKIGNKFTLQTLDLHF